MSLVSLCSHPTTPNTLVEQITGSIIPLAEGSLQFIYHLKGDLQSLLIPELTVSEPKDNLWQHSCFEAFIAVEGEKSYYEYNFSPSSQWAAYAFSDYRVRSGWQASQAPNIKREQQDDDLIITINLPASCLPDNPDAKPLKIGISAVIETRRNTISYWSLKHPENTPDFHHRESFNLHINSSS